MAIKLKKILIVEDELVDLFISAIRIVGKGQYKVYIAERGDSGVRKAKAIVPDLIIMDLRLPGMSGVEAIKAIREFDKDVIIFAITAFPEEYSMKTVLNAGANRFFLKPFNILELMDDIDKALGNA